MVQDNPSASFVSLFIILKRLSVPFSACENKNTFCIYRPRCYHTAKAAAAAAAAKQEPGSFCGRATLLVASKKSLS
jgi:hypothetical protein